MIPTLGRIVHAILPSGHKHQGGHRAAIVTAVYLDRTGQTSEASAVDVTVFLQTGETAGDWQGGPGLMFLTELKQDASAKNNGSWHEPERAEVETPKPIAQGVAASKSR